MAFLAQLAAQLESGEWLSARRLRLYVIILFACELAVFAFIVAGTHGWIVPLDKPNTTDFVSFYAAGRLADAGTPALAYDHAAHLAAEEAVVGQGIQYQYFNYPPVYAALFAPIAHLPYLEAFIAFETATLLIFLAVARRILDDFSSTALVALLAFPITWWNFGLGQNAFLTAALFGAATLLLDRRPVLAGLCFGALCYKPHFALLVPVALAAGRYWRAFAAAAVSAVVLVALSVALLGWNTWQAFFVTAGASHTMYESGRILFGGFVSPFGAMRLMGAGIGTSYAVQGVFTLIAALVVAMVWRRGLSPAARNAVLASATLLAVPLSLLYDMMIGAVAGCWLLRGARSETTHEAMPAWEKTALALIYAAMLDSRALAEALSIPVNTIAAVVLFALAARRALRELGLTSLSRRPASLRSGAAPTR
ncbi:MAG TPA: glycosyltransferase family 87 protein [Stellaceae bacterium]|nr:glycosyltransferase family 87 protein [Stellaceae bacterium]